MKSLHFSLSRLLASVVGAATLATVGMSGAQAASIFCGDSTLGVRVLEVDPASACIHAFTGNEGDGALEDLLDLKAGLSGSDASTLVDRDEAQKPNGPELSITGIEGTAGDWSILPSVWVEYGRVFLAFHFGGGGNTSADNPDSFIVELARADSAGSWELGGTGAQLNGLSNVALLGSGEGTADDDEDPNPAPEPGMLFLMGAGLLGLGMARRRKPA